MAQAAAGEELANLVARALAEDIGDGDVTSAATVDDTVRAQAVITQKQPGVIYGMLVAELCFRALDSEIGIDRDAPEGDWLEPGPVLSLVGSARAILAAERTALNFLARLSGVATMTALCVRAIEDTGARVLDTRKTTPGLRSLEKAAVRVGGGVNHRSGLYDAILIKENHVALTGGVGDAVRRARAASPDLPLEIECRTMEEIDDALEAGATRLLLDNMTPETLREAAEHVGARATLEASGGVTLETLRAIAASGVQFVSIGALTHSAPALDLSLTLKPLR